jgi:hypothetical protein
MKLVQFSTTEGQVWVNPDRVVFLAVISESRSMIRLDHDLSKDLLVNDVAENVAKRLSGVPVG